MRLAVLKERRAGETRVAATPETVKKLVALGLTVAVEAGAGTGVAIADADYTAAGAEIAGGREAALAGAGVVFAVQLPEPDELPAIPRGTLLVCISGLMANKQAAGAIAAAGIDLAAMELLPRITRAQSMDVLSSQANLAGYRSVIEGAFAFDRGFPMMMTAAGTVPPARVFVMGAGVAGLQAIATARRLGAIVSATDVRPAAKEEIKSLGATFIGVEDTETAGQTGAYAKEMSAEFRQKQAELIATTVAKNDMVICTALVQGGRAPTLVTQAMVDTMKPGSVIVDLASDGGGNCAATRPGDAYVTANGVKILGYRNWPGRIGVAASALYAKNLLTFLTTFWDKDAKAPKLPGDDAIIQGLMVTRGGAVVHPAFEGVGAFATPAAATTTQAAIAPEAAVSEAAWPTAAAAQPAAPHPIAEVAATHDAEPPAAPFESSSAEPSARSHATIEAAAPDLEPPPPEPEAPAPSIAEAELASGDIVASAPQPAEPDQAEPTPADALPAAAGTTDIATPAEPYAAAATEPAAPAAPSADTAAAKRPAKKPNGDTGNRPKPQAGGVRGPAGNKGGKQGGPRGSGGPSGDGA